MEQDSELREAVSLVIEAGYQIDRQAYDFLREISQTVDLDSLIRGVIEEADKLAEKPLYLSREFLEREAKEIQPSAHVPRPALGTGRTQFRPYAKEIDADLKVLNDPTDKISATGSLNDYIQHFQDRFRRLSRVMKNRLDVRDAGTITETFKAHTSSRVKFVCMIAEKRESSRGIFLRVEDPEADVVVFAPSENRNVLQKAQRLALDQVVCVCAVKGKGNLLVAEDITFPDIPLRRPNKAPIPVYAALLSDLHVGSKMFMKEAFQRFTLWLHGEVGNNRLQTIAGHVKYVLICGDVVDGVGIYPGQIEELEIEDVYGQYQLAAEMIEEIPEYIEVIIVPGNHDAVRRSLPQPAISKEYAGSLYESGRVHLLGNPSTLSLHGVNVLLSHGRSLDDVISTVPGMSFQAPCEGMTFLLQCRHLAPTYGLRTLIASERVDHLVIEEAPDIFHQGHVHVMDHTSYRGTLVVNSGAWQEQTEYQREMGHVPNPGIVPIVNLHDFNLTPIDFASRA